MPKRKKKAQKHSKKQKNQQRISNVDDKKKSLRTSLNVYNRLYHDVTLGIDLENVVIGYNDNIYGIQEMSINDWVMIDKGGDIPMHHILYFGLQLNNNTNNLLLWDRANKLDRLYGSGNTKDNQKWINIKKNIYQKNGLHPILLCIDATIKFIESHNDAKNDNNNDDDNDDKDDCGYPQLLVGRTTRVKSKFIHPKVSKKHKEIAAISAMVHKWGALSPFHLTDKHGRIIENVWQFSKVYKSIDAQNQVKFGKKKWIYSEIKNCLNDDNTPNNEYFKWRETGMKHNKAVRFPVGRKNRNKCLYSIKDKNNIQKLNYIESRKEIYVPLYISSLIKSPKYKLLKRMYDNGEYLLISEFDGPFFDDYQYYKDKYNKDNIVLKGDVMIPNKENLKILLNDEKHPFGHGYCIAMALQGFTINDLL